MKTATDRHFRRRSGLGLSLLQRPGTHFAAALVIPDGFQQDSPSHPAGMNPLLEHLSFSGGMADRVEALARKGLGINGWTDLEKAVFWAAGPAVHAPEALEFLSALLGSPSFTADDLRHELEVIRQEVAGRYYSLWDIHRDMSVAIVAQEQLERLAARSDLDGLSRLSFEEVRTAAAARMMPERAWLVVISPDPDTDIAATQLEAPGEELPAKSRERPSEAEPPPMPRVYTGCIKKADQAAIQRCFHNRPPGCHAGAAMTVISDVLGGGTYGELSQRLRQTVPLSYETGTTSLPLRDVSGLVLYAVVARNKAEDTLKVLNEITRQYREHGISDAAFEECRARLIQGIQGLDAQPNDVCGFVIESVMFTDGRGPVTPPEYLERIRKLELRTVNETCASLMRPERTLTTIVGDIGWWRRRKLVKLAQEF